MNGGEQQSKSNETDKLSNEHQGTGNGDGGRERESGSRRVKAGA